MDPYGGYQLQMTTEDVLIYPSGAARFIDDSTEEELDISQFEHNGSISAVINIENIAIDEEDILFAYCNEELRGKISADIFPLTGENVFSLMVYGDGINNEKLDFEFYDYQTIQMFKLNQTVLFEPDMIIGDAANPYLFDEVDNSIVSELEILSAYPNPFNPVTNISYYVNQNANIDVSVYNLMGRKVQSLDNSFKESGEYTISWDASNHASGIYYIQISNADQIKTQKITLIK